MKLEHDVRSQMRKCELLTTGRVVFRLTEVVHGSPDRRRPLKGFVETHGGSCVSDGMLFLDDHSQSTYHLVVLLLMMMIPVLTGTKPK